jgi:Sodium/hydrogen exchanger family
VLIGLQLRVVTDGPGGYAPITLVGDALAVIAVITAVRFAWLFSVPYLVRALDRRPAQRDRRVSAPDRLVIAWSGMRGAVSLAVALAIPLTTDAGHAFPQRDLIIFLTFAVIFFSLVAQGLSLAPLIRRLGIGSGDDDDPEEIRARLVATKAALTELDALESEDWTREHTITRLRGFYRYRQRRFAARAGTIDDDGYEAQTPAYQQTLQRVLDAQRDALLQMRNSAELSNETMNELMRPPRRGASGVAAGWAAVGRSDARERARLRQVRPNRPAGRPFTGRGTGADLVPPTGPHVHRQHPACFPPGHLQGHAR